MCGGGGSGGGNDATYWSNRENDQRNAEQLRADAAQRSADAEKSATREKFTTSIANAPNVGRNVATQYLSGRGLPVDEGILNSIVGNITRQVPDLDPNPEKYFTDEAIGRELDTVAQGTRDRLGNQINSTFAPGFERTLIADTADDPYINAILGEQRGTAQKAVDFNKARGLLNDTGYQTALNTLDTQGTAARGSLNQIGESVLGKSRQSLSDIRGEAGTAAGGYRYGGTAPDVGSYFSRAQKTAGESLAGLEGSIRGAVGSTNFFDAPTALQSGGTMQGPINLTTQPVGPGGVQVAALDKKNRGLGSTGVF